MEKETQQVIQILQKCAAKGEPIYYGDLYKLIGLSSKNSSDRMKCNKILADVNRSTMEKNGIMLSAIVIRKRDGSPGEGFYESAVELNLLRKSASKKDKIVFLKGQVNKILQS